MENNNAKYLRMTIYDNDYWLSLMLVGELLYRIFQSEQKYPTEKHLPYLKEYIKNLLESTNRAYSLNRYGVEYIENCSSARPDYFLPTLSFADYSDIQINENSEVVYVPLFENGEILLR